MTNMRRTVAKVALALTITGSLAVAGPGVAGAAPGPGGHHLRHDSGLARHRSCIHEQRVLAFELHNQQRFTTGTAAFAQLEASATKAGNPHLAAYWANVVNRRGAYTSKQTARLQARTIHDAAIHGPVNGKCA